MTLRNKVIPLIAACLILPIDLAWGAFLTISFPIALLLLPFAAYSFANDRSPQSLLLLFCFSASLTSAAIASSISLDASMRPLGSIIWFFLPLTAFFLGKRLVRSPSDLRQLVIYSANLGAVLSFALLFTIGYSHGFMVRTEGTLNGSFFGIPLSGMYGVHTISAHLYLVWGLVLFRHFFLPSTRMEKLISYFTVCALTYLMLMSLSREILLALLVTVGVITYRKYGVFILATMAATFLVVVYYFSGYLIEDSLWATKIAQSLNASDLNELSSGRIELQLLAISQLIHRPLIGTGFYGYALDFTQSDGYPDLSGWSTHAYFLTAIWKMGIPAGIAFICFLYSAVARSICSLKQTDKSLAKFHALMTITFLLIVNSLWDAMLAPSVSILFMFLLGATQFRSSQLPNTTLKHKLYRSR